MRGKYADATAMPRCGSNVTKSAAFAVTSLPPGLGGPARLRMSGFEGSPDVGDASGVAVFFEPPQPARYSADAPAAVAPPAWSARLREMRRPAYRSQNNIPSDDPASPIRAIARRGCETP